MSFRPTSSRARTADNKSIVRSIICLIIDILVTTPGASIHSDKSSTRPVSQSLERDTCGLSSHLIHAMLFPNPSTATPTLLLFLLPFLASAISLDCSDIRDKEVSFNLKALAGPHSIYKIQDHANSYQNTTFTIDICAPLKKTKGVPKDEDCPNGSRGKPFPATADNCYSPLLPSTCLSLQSIFLLVCAIERLHNIVEDKDTIEDTYAIAGEYGHSIGGNLDPSWTRLRSSDSTSDREKEGVRIELKGGKHEKQKQKAVVEFLCDKDSKGDDRRRNAKDDDGDDDDEKPSDGENKPHDKSGEEQGDDHGGMLKYISWKDEEDDTKVLRLEWTTKYACEDGEDNSGGSSSSGHWGFFTWLIIM